MRKLSFAITTGLISLLALGAGTARAQSERQGNVTKPKAPTPFEIAKAVNESKRIWKKNHTQVVVDLGLTWEQLGIDRGAFAGCSGDCEAKIYRHELDSTPGKEIILKLTQSYNFCRYLIFARARTISRARSKWKLLGYIDHDFNRYEMARHRFVTAFGQNWLVIRGQEGSGSGYYLYGETWYEVNNRAVRPVLNYSVDGHTDPVVGGLKWELKGRPVALATAKNRKRVVKLIFEVVYTASGFDNSEFTRRFLNRRRAEYVWNPRSREFVFDSRSSTISVHEMNVIANIDSEPSEGEEGVRIGGSTFFSGLKGFVGGGYEMFLRLNVRRLLTIVKGKDNRAKDWLREFLKECDAIPEKSTIAKALQISYLSLRNQR